MTSITTFPIYTDSPPSPTSHTNHTRPTSHTSPTKKPKLTERSTDSSYEDLSMINCWEQDAVVLDFDGTLVPHDCFGCLKTMKNAPSDRLIERQIKYTLDNFQSQIDTVKSFLQKKNGKYYIMSQNWQCVLNVAAPALFGEKFFEQILGYRETQCKLPITKLKARYGYVAKGDYFVDDDIEEIIAMQNEIHCRRVKTWQVDGEFNCGHNSEGLYKIALEAVEAGVADGETKQDATTPTGPKTPYRLRL